MASQLQDKLDSAINSVRMFFTLMINKRKLRKPSPDNLSGTALADWLNGPNIRGLPGITAIMIALRITDRGSFCERWEPDPWLDSGSPAADISHFPHTQDPDFEDPIKWASQTI